MEVNKPPLIFGGFYTVHTLAELLGSSLFSASGILGILYDLVAYWAFDFEIHPILHLKLKRVEVEWKEEHSFQGRLI